jgi:hypothetical protein
MIMRVMSRTSTILKFGNAVGSSCFCEENIFTSSNLEFSVWLIILILICQEIL